MLNFYGLGYGAFVKQSCCKRKSKSLLDDDQMSSENESLTSSLNAVCMFEKVTSIIYTANRVKISYRCLGTHWEVVNKRKNSV